MRQLLIAPAELPAGLGEPMRAMAVTWAESSLRPRIEIASLAYWDKLVDAWIADASLPLYVRKSGRDNPRGSIVRHTTGRKLVPTDNSPAHWSFMSAFAGRCLTLAEVKAEINADQIPVAMALSRAEKSIASYRCCRSAIGNPNDKGWKLCHIRPVALKARSPFPDVPLEIIHRHFKDFISPSNMFLIPKSISGLGEVRQFIDAMGQFQDRP